MRAAAAAVVGALTLVAAPDARADDAQAAADRLFDEGLAHYNLGEYAAAAAAFREAYRLVREPLFLFNLGQAHRKAGECALAVDMYGAFLREADGPTNRDKAEQFIRELEPCAAEQRAARAATAAGDPGVAPASAPTLTEPPPTRRIRRDRGSRLRLGGLGITAGGVGVIAVGSYYWTRSRALQDDLAAACGSAGCDWANPQHRAIDAAGHQANRRAWIASLAGAGLVAAGVGLYAWGHTRREWVVVPVAAASGDGGAVVVAGGF